MRVVAFCTIVERAVESLLKLGRDLLRGTKYEEGDGRTAGGGTLSSDRPV